MPNYRVGVSLDLRGNYGAGLTGAASQTERFRGVVSRAAGGAAAALRRTAGAAAGVGDVVGRTARRSTSGLQRVTGAAGNAAGALERTAGAARRVGTASRTMADTVGSAMGRARGKVNDLIGRFRALERTSRNAGGVMSGAGGVMSGGVGRLAGYAGGGFAIARAGQSAASMDTLIRRLQVETQGGRSLEELRDLRDHAYEIGADRGVHATELMEAVSTAQGEGGVQIDKEDMEALAIIMQRAGVGGAEAAKVWARVSMLPGETRENVATLAMQADNGELTFREMISQITRMVAAVRTWGTDETAVRQMGAMMNVARAGSGSVDEAGEAMSTLTREALARAEEIKKGFGINVLSTVPGREGFLRPDFLQAVMQIAAQAGSRHGGGEAKIIEVFGADSLKAMKTLLTQEGMDKAKANFEIQGEWSGVRAGADQVAEGIEARGIAMTQKLEGRFTSLITGPMQSAFTLMQAHQTELMVGGAGLLAAFNLRSRYRLRRTVTEGFRAQTAATSTVATMRVGTLIVSSMPGGAGTGGRGPILGPDGKPAQKSGAGGRRTTGVPAAGSSGGVVGRTAGRASRFTGWARTAGRGIPYAGAGIAALSLVPALASGNTRNVVQSTAGLAGGWGGMLGGAKMGGFLGAFAGPFGAAIGGAIGGLIGGGAGWWAAGKAVNALDPDTWRPRVDVELDAEGRPTQSVRGRVRHQNMVARTAGVEREPDGEDVDTEDVDGQPRRSVRGRVRRNDLVARTAGVEREPDEEDVDTEDVDGQPRRSVRGRVRRGDLVARTAGVEREPDEEDVDTEDVDGQPRRSVRGRVRRGDLVARTAGVEREPDEENVDTEDVDGQPRRSVRGRVRRNDLVARTAGVEREPDKEDVDMEDVDGQPRRSVRGRVRRNDLVARTAGVEREPDEENVDTEDVDGQPRRSVRGRVRRKELSVRGTVPELQPARATYDHSDHSDHRSTVNIAPGAITVQAAEDPEATAEAVADRVMEITERERQRRDRRIRDTALEDPDPDPVL